MIKIMFVCHGNICRSPMAEFVMKKLVTEKGMTKEFNICSSATSDEEIYGGIGNPVYPPAKKELEKHGILCDGKRAVQLKKSDYGKYDLFICMDGNNVRNAIRIFGGDSEGKISRLLEHAFLFRDVADPWYSGDFETAYRDIYTGCRALLDKLVK